MLIDSHCHLDFDALSADLDGVMARAEAAQVNDGEAAAVFAANCCTLDAPAAMLWVSWAVLPVTCTAMLLMLGPAILGGLHCVPLSSVPVD